MKSIIISKTDKNILPFNWDDDFWEKISSLRLDYHRIENKQFPSVEVKVCYNSKNIFLFWKVKEKEILCNQKTHFDKVYQDSCVEFFVKPFGAKGYFNFEINCIGRILCYYVTNWQIDLNGTLKEFKRINLDDINKIEVSSSITDDKLFNKNQIEEWLLLIKIPFEILLNASELLESDFSQNWNANFYKCADKSILPHWSSWNPVSELNFHQPKDFGELIFEK